MKAEVLIKTKARVKNFAEVFTPSFLVKEMLDLLDAGSYDSKTTYLDPACGNGNFLIEVLRRKIAKVREDYTGEEPAEWLFYDCLSSIYGVDIQLDNVEECRERLFYLAYSQLSSSLGINPIPFVGIFRDVLKQNIRHGDSLKGDFIIGSHNRKGDSLTVEFHKYADVAKGINKPLLSYSMILPRVDEEDE